ncbi:MAG: low-specificity L-threonine aldolase [Ignavibacteriae bacterium]|nr:low-specificity L-threonine aldolase [Ignavibacteriota bacterium]
MKIIDLRSDTLTKPTKAMMEAIMNAEVGDDVFEEDPTVNELQDMCSMITGMDAALFVPTGVMGNQLAIKCHTQPGDEVIVESESHILNYETAAPSVISNVQLLPVKGNMGIMNVEDIAKVVRTSEYYFPVTRLICLENTHNREGGVIQPIDTIKETAEFAKLNNIKLHLDGARIFNAIAETGISLKDYADHFDSISFCFSKGLGSPVGSIVCGNKNFIEHARKWRKILGGGMRQVGILAAAALFALKNNVNRLKEDNENAKYFAEEISNIKGIELDLKTVQTNIVVFSCTEFSKAEFMLRAKEKGLIISSGSYEKMRVVFYMGVDRNDADAAVKIIRQILKEK